MTPYAYARRPPAYHVVAVPPAGPPEFLTLSSVSALLDVLAAAAGGGGWAFVVAGGERVLVTGPPRPGLVFPDGRRVAAAPPAADAPADPAGALFADEPRADVPPA